MSVHVNLSGTNKLIYQIQQLRKDFPDEVKAMYLEVALVDIETYAKNETDIPVDTGRLRASIHTKYSHRPTPKNRATQRKLSAAAMASENGLPLSQSSYFYTVTEGEGENSKEVTYNGTLSVQPDEWNVYVGTNVQYAKKINRVGGGGPNSKRTDESGAKFAKGKGQHFWTKAVENGRENLRREMGLLYKRIQNMLKKSKNGGGKP
jgi:hypothetical protein